MSMFNDIMWGSEDIERECIANATLVTIFFKKISTRTLVIPRTWIRKEVVFYVTTKDHEKTGTESLN